MKMKFITALALAAGGLMSPAVAETSGVVSNGVPDAPTVADAPLASAARTVDSAPKTTGPNQVVYTSQLPSVQELTDAAAAKGTTILRVEQLPSEILTTYRFSNGQERVVAYRVLPSAGSVSSSTVVIPPPPPVVYVPSPRVVYYDSYRSYDPWFWNPPVSFRIGLGFYGGHYHQRWYHDGHHRWGHHHGGFRHRSHHHR
jgi:hypothetical protein